MGALRPFLLKERSFEHDARAGTDTDEADRTRGRDGPAGRRGARGRAQNPERFTVFVDHAEGVDHALCARVTDVLREYLREYAIDVSSPGSSAPCARPSTSGTRLAAPSLRTPERKRLKGEVVSAGAQSVVVRSGEDTVEIPYDHVVRANLVYEQ